MEMEVDEVADVAASDGGSSDDDSSGDEEEMELEKQTTDLEALVRAIINFNNYNNNY